MSNSLKIEKHDIVDVFFEYGQPLINMTVEYVPHATGDSWILLTDERAVVYVQHFSQMHLRQKYKE
jgi:hypothetical protein